MFSHGAQLGAVFLLIVLIHGESVCVCVCECVKEKKSESERGKERARERKTELVRESICVGLGLC